MELLTTSEVAKILRISKRTLYCYTSLGLISYIKIKKKLLFRKEDIDEFLLNKVNNTQDIDDIVFTIKDKIQRALRGI